MEWGERERSGSNGGRGWCPAFFGVEEWVEQREWLESVRVCERMSERVRERV